MPTTGIVHALRDTHHTQTWQQFKVKALVKIFATLLLILTLGGLALFNSEIFYSEFWLQRDLNQYSCIEPLENIKLGNQELGYKFFLDDDVDLEITINETGYVFIGINRWFKSAENSKGHYFEIKPERAKRLIQHYQKLRPRLKSNSLDNHIGGHYYRVNYRNSVAPEQNTEIGYYNVKPEKEFEELRQEFLEIGKDVLGKI